MSDVNYEQIFLDLSSLLDGIEMAFGEEDYERAEQLVKGRFDVFEKHGLTVEFTSMPASGRTQ